MQHREIQGHESEKFLSYFKPCIIPLEGGVASGFKKPEEEQFETRLYVCRGKRVVRMKQALFFFTGVSVFNNASSNDMEFLMFIFAFGLFRFRLLDRH